MIETVRHFKAEQVLPSVESILIHQGIPPGAKINNRTETLVDGAIKLFLEIAKPSAITKIISVEEFDSVYEGQGNNQADDPLKNIYKNSSRLLLFAATVGKKVSEEINNLMSAGDLAEGSLLDAVASGGADCVAELIQNESAVLFLKDNSSGTKGVMRFSPGYCGWDISGQKKLFETLNPSSVGISLNKRFLMHPLKAVSGVIVISEKNSFEFENCFSFCVACRNRSCQKRYQEMLTRTFK